MELEKDKPHLKPTSVLSNEIRLPGTQTTESVSKSSTPRNGATAHLHGQRTRAHRTRVRTLRQGLEADPEGVFASPEPHFHQEQVLQNAEVWTASEDAEQVT